MERDTLKHLCKLSRLSFDESGAEKLLSEMTDIIGLMDTIKDFDLTYDDRMDHNSIAYTDVREDIPQPSFPAEKLLSNAVSAEGCYVVPKVVE